MDINETKSADRHRITNGHNAEDAEEIEISMPWGHISGKWWGPRDKQPILALHGWQDNANTFDNLVELLPSNIAILTIDLPGHGFSSHLPFGQYYYIIWDGVILLRRIVNHYKWNKVKLLGHSLGGAISFIYAASYPDEVDFLISLDITGPNVRNVTKVAPLTGDYIDKFLKYDSLTVDSAPCYQYNEMIQIVEMGYEGSITKEAAKILMKRGMQSAFRKGEYYFSRDPRLKASLLGIPSADMILQYASQIKCAYLNIRALSGQFIQEQTDFYLEVLEKIKEGAKRFEYHEVEGTHHVHLNEPEKVAPIINNFLRD